ncbi:MAG: C-terminal binding protein [Oscillospiraceae bacterium]
MKVIFAEAPSTCTRDMSVERSCFPEGTEFVIAVFDEHSENNDKFYEQVSDADIVINGYVYLGEKELDAMKKCKVVSFQSTGFNAIDIDYATKKGIAVVSIEDYCTQETAENAMALMLCLQRGLITYNDSVQIDKEWIYDKAKDLKRIEGQVMGIVGLGRIGQSVARKAKGFDMEVIAYDPFLPKSVAEGLGVKLVEIDELLAVSDVISVHMNLTDDNVNFFNKEKFAKCLKKPIIINEGRGGMISEEDLAWALDEGLIKGAALDMLESEFPDLKECKLMGRPNVIITPHCGFFSDTSMYLLCQCSAMNALNYFNGDYDAVKVIRNGIRG